ncbi:MAG: threonine synthase [Oscillospiraceae bacterium]|nr:threonine synthase [Oscillospiraceae bacterium]
MRYTSTRDNNVSVSAAQAVVQGISPEGGLYVPEKLPQLTVSEINALTKMDYVGRAAFVLSKFFTEEGPDGWEPEELSRCVKAAYGGTFRDPAVAPVKALGGGGRSYLLELFHGPTCAFKDLALQLLPRLLTASAQKVLQGKEIVILTATSGDTGKAALEGFKDVPGTRIIVFYPSEGVSDLQRLQMVTQEGANVGVVGVEGNFDDTQSGVKSIFTCPSLRAELEARDRVFSSANSINWGRLAPQIVYYVSAYCDLRREGKIAAGEKINFVVPTGNFGNILAAYYAREMGLPVARLICASNRNRILTDFLATGVYDRRRDFYTTLSPSMDILISSNLERLLYAVSGCDAGAVSGWMGALSRDGSYEIPETLLKALQKTFAAGSCNDTQTKGTIRQTYTRLGYLSDTHTAVGLRALEDYRGATGDNAVSVVVSTASPYKFADSVLSAITGGGSALRGFEAIAALEALTGVPCPAPLKSLREKPIRFTELCQPGDMAEFVANEQ